MYIQPQKIARKGFVFLTINEKRTYEEMRFPSWIIYDKKITET